MHTRVAINGFGRIGRMLMRILADKPDIQVVAVNASYDSHTLAHLLKYDTVHGRFHLPVEAADSALIVAGRRVELVAERNPALLPWAGLGIDTVIEATGKFRSRSGAGMHLSAGARRVVITAPGKDVDGTFVYGVNHGAFAPEKHAVVSAASCTTTCLAPLAKVLHERFDLLTGLMTTIHSFTNDQNALDNPHKDLRRARASSLVIAPTSTGAASAVGKVLPALKGKLNGFALRVPTPDVSVVDLTAQFRHPVTAESINAALREAAVGAMQGIIAVSDEPLVSSDYIGNPHSCIVDALSTMVGEGNLAKVIAWYDNEYGYSCRVADLVAHMARVSRISAALAGRSTTHTSF